MIFALGDLASPALHGRAESSSWRHGVSTESQLALKMLQLCKDCPQITLGNLRIKIQIFVQFTNSQRMLLVEIKIAIAIEIVIEETNR